LSIGLTIRASTDGRRFTLRYPGSKCAKLLAMVGMAALALSGRAMASTLITGATVYDGSGAGARHVSVRVDGDRIAAIGHLRPLAGETIIKADGLVLSPGFIDSHSHHDRGDYADRALPSLLAQGVTTIIIGQDGESSAPAADIAAGLAKRPIAINVGTYTGHGFLREKVMGPDYKRAASDDEIAAMQTLLKADLEAGSLGLSTGLEYDPGILFKSRRVAGPGPDCGSRRWSIHQSHAQRGRGVRRRPPTQGPGIIYDGFYPPANA